MRRRLNAAAVAAACALGMTVVATPASAQQQPAPPPQPNSMPSAVPSTATPSVDDGDVRAIAKVGATVVLGGNFTSVDGQGRQGLAAFNAATGNLTSFSASANGEVSALAPGPTSDTVYVGGAFSTINGTAVPGKVALLNLTSGTVVPTFAAPRLASGIVRDFVVTGNRILAVGTFTKVAGVNHGGVVAMNATTGAIDNAYVNLNLTGHHNDTGSGAQGPVGPWNIDVTPSGDKAVLIGNFKYADGELRDQVLQLDLRGTASLANWATQRYDPKCFNFAFDSYVRGVTYSPDGSYFVVASTGGGVPNTLCDAAARFETAATGTSIQPTWVTETGGDTAWAVEVTTSSVFVGGHQRWANNPYGSDYANNGAVPRPGLMALDPISGRPLSWNPGRNPAGKTVYALLATDNGLYMGSNTDWVGNRKYKRPKIALFPYVGDTAASTATGVLPGTVFYGGVQGAGQSNILYRVNAGGSALGASDNGPDWSADADSTSPWRNATSNAAGYSSGASVDSTVPQSTPNAVFDSERWDPNDANEMDWSFPVTAGTPVQVRVFLANRCSCTSATGSRVFDIQLNEQPWVENLDLSGQVGDQKGTMKSVNLTVPTNGFVKLGFRHKVENPLVNGIEILRTDIAPPPSASSTALNRANVSTVGATPAPTIADSGVDWSKVRGAFMVGNQVFTAETDGMFYTRSFNGTTFGVATAVNPYHDPVWKDVSNNLGGTYDGKFPSLYGNISSITGMFYDGGKLYYTLRGQSAMLARWFSPDSGIMDERTNTVASNINFSNTNGAFVAGGMLHYVTSDGSLNKVAWADGVTSGTPTLVSGPATGGPSFLNRALFLNVGPVANLVPTASFTQSCAGGTCSFDGSGSSDADGSVVSYAWDFGDGADAAGATTTHAYAASGTYQVTLLVKDNKDAPGTTSQQLTVSVPVNQAPTAAFTSSCTGATCAFDGSPSSDPGGSVASYAWDFGDGTNDTGASPSHAYAATGTYTVMLRVTDNMGATGSVEHDVSVTVPAATVSFVGAGHSTPGAAKVKSAALPNEARAGDTALLYFSRPTNTSLAGPTGITGWTQLGSVTNSTVISEVWRKTLTAADLGKAATFTDSTYRLGSVLVAVYRGVEATPSTVTSGVDAAAVDHITPAVAVTSGDLVVRYVASKSAVATGWNVPDGLTSRTESVDTGGTRFNTVVADSGTAAPTNGTAPPVTISTVGAADRSVMWSVTLPGS